MADQWEMCEISYDFDHVFFYTPEGATGFTLGAFLRNYDPSFESLGNTEDSRLVICRLLSEGWEPFAEDGHEYFFRRQYQG
jgi:hypothetical protein